MERSHIQNNCVTQIGFDVEKEDTSSIGMETGWIQEELGKNDQNPLHEILKELIKLVGMWSRKRVGVSWSSAAQPQGQSKPVKVE